MIECSCLPDSFGSAFPFDFVRNPSRQKKPLLRDLTGSWKSGRSSEARSAESSPVECNGGKSLEMQLRFQNQQEEVHHMRQEQAKLREELSSQKVHSSLSHYRIGRREITQLTSFPLPGAQLARCESEVVMLCRGPCNSAAVTDTGRRRCLVTLKLKTRKQQFSYEQFPSLPLLFVLVLVFWQWLIGHNGHAASKINRWRMCECFCRELVYCQLRL